MRHNKKSKFPAKYMLLIMTAFCILVIVCSVRVSTSSGPASTFAGYVIIPMQKGINRVGTALTDVSTYFVSKKKLQTENKELSSRINELQSQLNETQMDQHELDNLKSLYKLDKKYSSYKKVAANVIGKDSGNWFSTFIIDRGKDDGIKIGMNVIADGGLVGIVTDAGPNYAKIRSIIDDSSNVSGMVVSTSDLCIVNGSLKSMDESQLIDISSLNDSKNKVKEGDQIVTSAVSDLYLKGIPIGYLTDIKTDSNGLTKSGHLATIVDFEHLESVFVILTTKNTDK